MFIGKGRVPPDEDAPSYITADQEVGYSSIFAYKPDADCDNCIANRDLMYADLIPLMTMLPDFLEANQKPDDVWPPRELRQLKNLEPDGSDGHPGVRDFLREQLEWRIVDIAGNVRSAEEVTASGLELVFVARTFTLPTNEQPLGEYGQQVLYTDITAGKVGGYRG